MAIKDRPDETWQDIRAAKLEKWLAPWVTIWVSWAGAGSQIDACRKVADLEPGREQIEMVGFYLRSKAPSTLLKRSGSIFKLHGRVGWGIKPEDFTEIFVYHYLKHARSTGAKSGQLQALMEALVFVRYIFNVPTLDHALSSRRCKGWSLVRRP